MANRHNPQLRHCKHCKTVKKKHSFTTANVKSAECKYVFPAPRVARWPLSSNFRPPPPAKILAHVFFMENVISEQAMKSVDLTFVTATVALRHYSDIVALAKPPERRRGANELDFLRLIQTKECVWWRADFVDLQTLKY